MAHDVIIVGARCAGATTATLLQREGVRALVLEAAERHADMPMSTHFLQPPGMDVLDELGVGDKVRAVTPPTRCGRYRMETHDILGPFPQGRPAYCVRRATLDPLLQDAAEDAGAQVRYGHRVVELIQDAGRVAGVVVEGPAGRERIHADLVIGADGRASTVARLAGVEEYLVHEAPRAGYWFYFPTPDMWRDDPRYRDFDSVIAWEGDGLRYLFQCDGDVLLMAAAAPTADARSWGRDYRERTLEYLRRSDIFAPLLTRTEPLGKGMGFLGADFFYRRPVGPGFALVGDAGNFKDFVTGQGMTDAFLGAKRLTRAVLADTPVAYERYWRERDAETMAMYFDALHLGRVDVNNAFTRLVFEYVKRSPELSRRLGMVFARQRHPFNIFTAGEVLPMVARGLLRGRLGAPLGMLEHVMAIREFADKERHYRALAREVRSRARATDPESLR